MAASGSPNVVCREIAEPDLPAVVDCLARHFPERTRTYWSCAVDQLRRRETPEGCPRFGQMLEAEHRVVGVLLQIFSVRDAAQGNVLRCNLSSWCVDEDYRALALVLQSRATQRRDATYVNITPAPHTTRFLEATGFTAYAGGRMLFAPLLGRAHGDARVREYDENDPESSRLSQNERRLLAEHRALGCLSLMGLKDGAARPLVFQRRRLPKLPLPCLHVVFCRDIADLALFARPLGLYFARRGLFLAVADANGPAPGLTGAFLRGQMPHYFKDGPAPCPCDLAYTEVVLFGR